MARARPEHLRHRALERLHHHGLGFRPLRGRARGLGLASRHLAITLRQLLFVLIIKDYL